MRCINGSLSTYANCIGFCNSFTHKGYVTANLEHQHRCFEKQCKSFRPLIQNSYWINQQRIADEKEERKKIRKEQKNMEESILKNVPHNAKPVFCKYLYDMTYLLILNEFCDIPCKYYKDLLDINVYVKYVPENECNNIDVAFQRFLPQEMRRKYIDAKAKNKNGPTKERI